MGNNRRRWMMGTLAVAGVLGLAVAIPAVTGLGFSASAEESNAVKEEDQEAFDRIRDAQAVAWDEEDGAAFAATFTEDADVITFNGDHLHTREGIAEGMQYYFDEFIEDSHFKVLDETVRYIDDDTVTIIRNTCLTEGDDTECRDGSESVNANILVKEDGEWQQTSFQNTRVEALP